jgi:hypothetical protein
MTKDFEHDVTHIYPFSLRGQTLEAGPPEVNIWTALPFFWSKNRVKAWQKAIFPQGPFVEVCYNLMCLSPSAHHYQRKGYFALKPVSMSEDQKCLTVKFFWLLKGSHPSYVNLCDAPSVEGRDQGPCYARLWNHETSDPIQSGDEIRLETEDPENLPLPSWELLEMQWFLNRVVAISGAADIEDDYDDDDYDDGDYDDDDYDDDDYDDDDNNDQIFLEQEQDLDMLDAFYSEDEQQSPHTEHRSLSSPPSSLHPSSPGLQKRTIWSHPVASLSAATEATANAVDTSDPGKLVEMPCLKQPASPSPGLSD